MGRVVWLAVRTRVRVGIVEIKELGISPAYFVVVLVVELYGDRSTVMKSELFFALLFIAFMGMFWSGVFLSYVFRCYF